MYIDKLTDERVEDHEAYEYMKAQIMEEPSVLIDFIDCNKDELMKWFFDYEEGSDDAMPKDTPENLGMSESDFF